MNASMSARRRWVGAVLGTVVAIGATLLTGIPAAQADSVTVTTDTQYSDTSGSPVQAHGGGVIKVGDFFYWFGENRNDDNSFRFVSVYRSSDLKNWEFRNNVLTQSSAAELATANIERPKVIYNATTGQFVMWMHKETSSDYSQARVAVATSSTVDGDYTYRGSFRPLDAESRDMTLFQDTDGSAYLVSSSNGNADLVIFRLSDDYLSVASKVATPWPGAYREAPALFRRDGVYFMLSSTTSGWNPNQQKYATATSLSGPWTAQTVIGDRITYNSQTAYVLPVQGTSGTSYLYMGDHWGNSFGSNVNGSKYVWLPLRFPTRTTMVLPYYPQLAIDTASGTLTGVGGGPYRHLVAQTSGKCVDVPDNSSDNGVGAIQYTCNGGLNQQFRVVDAGDGYVRLVAEHSGRCLDVDSASTADGATVLQYDCGSGSNQQWRVTSVGGGYDQLVSRNSGKCLDVSGASSADGAKLIQYTCSSSAGNQRFGS